MGGWKAGRADGRIDGQVDGRDGRTDGQTNGTDGRNRSIWTDMDGCLDRSITKKLPK